MKPRLLFLFLLLPLLAGAQTYTYSTIVYFGPASEGGPFYPISEPLMDAQGNFYGTTEAGGEFNLGTVFKVTPSGDATVLHSFNGADGQLPESDLVRDSHNNLYGTTVQGGAYTYYGTIFKVAPDGTETVMYSFPGTFPDGGNPRGAPGVLDNAGNLYGTTVYAGNNFNYDGGSIFKLAPNGRFTLLYHFCNQGACPNGDDPGVSIIDKAGNLWGVTAGGGANSSGNVFMLTPAGQLTVVYSFPCCVAGPVGPLLSSGNNFYVATNTSIYKVTTTGVGSVFYTFPAHTHPNGQLAIDSAGNLYGTTDSETVFQITPEGVETTIFTGTDSEPIGGSVILDKAGNLYGTTPSAGQYFAGSIFELTKSGD